MESDEFLWKFCRLFGIFPVVGGVYSRRSYWRGVSTIALLSGTGTLFVLWEGLVSGPEERIRTRDSFGVTILFIDYMSMLVAAAAPFAVSCRAVTRVHRAYSRVVSRFPDAATTPGLHRAYLITEILWTAYVVSDTAHWLDEKPRVALYVLFVLLSYFVFNSQVMISSMIIRLALGYRTVNLTLTQGRLLASEFKPYFILKGEKRSRIVTLQSVMTGYGLLKYAETCLRDAYGVTTLLHCLCVFTRLFIMPYHALQVFKSLTTPYSGLLIFGLGQLSFTLFNSAQLLFITVPPSLKTREASNTGYLLAKLLSEDMPKNVVKRLKHYVLRTYYDAQNSAFTMCGLQIDMSLIKNMIHSAILYVVILVQFKPSTF